MESEYNVFHNLLLQQATTLPSYHMLCQCGKIMLINIGIIVKYLSNDTKDFSLK